TGIARAVPDPPEPTAAPHSLGFTPEGDRLVVASEDATVRVWSPPTGACDTCLTGVAGPPGMVSPDGSRVASVMADGLQVRTVAAPARRVTLVGSASTVVRSVSFATDGRRIAVGGDAGSVEVWDAQAGSPVVRLAAHAGAVRVVSFAPGGERVASGGDDGH